MAQYPHIRVFYGSDGLVHFMPFTDAEHNGQYAEKHIGQGLIDFVELDLSKYRLWLEAAKSIPLTMEHYQEVRDAVYDVAETLKHEFMAGHPEFGDAAVKMQYAILPKKKGKVDIDMLRDIRDWKLTEQDDLLEYLDEMLFFEFTEMLKNGQYVKHCKLCGRYFVLTDKRKRDFCDRPYTSKRTCKQVGAKLFFEKGIEDDTFLLQYLTEYNKVYSRRYRAAGKYAEVLSGRDLTGEQFKSWSAAASQARRDYVEGKISGEEMLARVRLD